MVAAETTVEDLAVGADHLVLLVDHAAYRTLDPVAIGQKMGQRNVLDTRNFLSADRWREAGFQVARLGDGRSQVTELNGGEPPG